MNSPVGEPGGVGVQRRPQDQDRDGHYGDSDGNNDGGRYEHGND